MNFKILVFLSLGLVATTLADDTFLAGRDLADTTITGTCANDAACTTAGTFCAKTTKGTAAAVNLCFPTDVYTHLTTKEITYTPSTAGATATTIKLAPSATTAPVSSVKECTANADCTTEGECCATRTVSILNVPAAGVKSVCYVKSKIPTGQESVTDKFNYPASQTQFQGDITITYKCMAESSSAFLQASAAMIVALFAVMFY